MICNTHDAVCMNLCLEVLNICVSVLVYYSVHISLLHYSNHKCTIQITHVVMCIKSSEIQHFKHSNTIEICDKVMLVFCHMYMYMYMYSGVWPGTKPYGSFVPDTCMLVPNSPTLPLLCSQSVSIMLKVTIT